MQTLTIRDISPETEKEIEDFKKRYGIKTASKTIKEVVHQHHRKTFKT